MTALDRARPRAGRWAAPSGTALGWGDPEVGVPELPLDDHQRYALARHLDSVGMPQLMWRQPATHPSCDRGVAQLHTEPGR